MSPLNVKLFRILLAFTSTCIFFLSPKVQAEWHYSSNSADYDFGWFASGTYAPGSVPYCSYCVNGLSYDPIYAEPAADLAKGFYWNRTVAMYRCDGVENNERWAYHKPTSTIVFSNLTTVLCIDAVVWDSLGVLKLRPCNSSAVTQQWRQEGNGIISGSPGSNGEKRSMVAQLPSKETNPTSQQYEFTLKLSSSLPSVSSPGFSYTSNFSILSSKNLLDTSTNRFTPEGLLQINNKSLDQIVNGGFESSTIQAGSDITWSDWTQPVPSYFALCGWVIDYGPIDYVKSGLLQSAEGSYSVHLNTHSDADHWGSISQTFRTEVGNEYLLSFSFNGFPPQLQIGSRPTWNCSARYKEARLQVGVTNATSNDKVSGGQFDGTGLQQNFTIDVTNVNSLNIGALWQIKTVKFRASTNVTRVSFSSLNVNDSCGPMIDAVKLSRLRPESGWNRKLVLGTAAGSVGGLAIVIAGILGFAYMYRRRYFGANEDYSGLYRTENAGAFFVEELNFSTMEFGAVLRDQGAFGAVYKADTVDGTEGAVTVEKPRGLNSSSKVRAADKLAVLQRAHHRNLVNLTGFCIHKGRHMLVYECLPNGSLYDRLHQPIVQATPGTSLDSGELRRSQANVLPWQKRVKIASDVAHGLEYLHHDADPPIVHKDVRSQNILLTAADSAKLGNFGVCKADHDAPAFPSIDTLMRGTLGYLDPQYFVTGVLSPKSDVYSYGIVLLELISGHQAIYNGSSIASWAAPYMTAPSLYHQLVDKKLDGEFNANELHSLVELSTMCMQTDTELRPSMREVVAFLSDRQLSVADIDAESSEEVEDSISGELTRKVHPSFIDFEPVLQNSGGKENFLLSSTQPRD